MALGSKHALGQNGRRNVTHADLRLRRRRCQRLSAMARNRQRPLSSSVTSGVTGASRTPGYTCSSKPSANSTPSGFWPPPYRCDASHYGLCVESDFSFCTVTLPLASCVTVFFSTLDPLGPLVCFSVDSTVRSHPNVPRRGDR